MQNTFIDLKIVQLGNCCVLFLLSFCYTCFIYSTTLTGNVEIYISMSCIMRDVVIQSSDNSF